MLNARKTSGMKKKVPQQAQPAGSAAYSAEAASGLKRANTVSSLEILIQDCIAYRLS
jgi:hypothetical protein